jgi:hypothetical protein
VAGDEAAKVQLERVAAGVRAELKPPKGQAQLTGLASVCRSPAAVADEVAVAQLGDSYKNPC